MSRDSPLMPLRPGISVCVTAPRGTPCSLLSLVTGVLATADLSSERSRADLDKLKEKPAVLTLLLDFMLDLLLLPYG